MIFSYIFWFLIFLFIFFLFSQCFPDVSLRFLFLVYLLRFFSVSFLRVLFIRAGQKQRVGRSVATPTNQPTKVFEFVNKVNLATLKVAIIPRITTISHKNSKPQRNKNNNQQQQSTINNQQSTINRIMAITTVTTSSMEPSQQLQPLLLDLFVRECVYLSTCVRVCVSVPQLCARPSWSTRSDHFPLCCSFLRVFVCLSAPLQRTASAYRFSAPLQWQVCIGRRAVSAQVLTLAGTRRKTERDVKEAASSIHSLEGSSDESEIESGSKIICGGRTIKAGKCSAEMDGDADHPSLWADGMAEQSMRDGGCEDDLM